MHNILISIEVNENDSVQPKRKMIKHESEIKKNY